MNYLNYEKNQLTVLLKWVFLIPCAPDTKNSNVSKFAFKVWFMIFCTKMSSFYLYVYKHSMVSFI